MPIFHDVFKRYLAVKKLEDKIKEKALVLSFVKLSLNFVDSSSADNQRLIEAVVQLCCRTGPSMLRYFNLSLEPVNQMTHQMTKNAKSTV